MHTQSAGLPLKKSQNIKFHNAVHTVRTLPYRGLLKWVQRRCVYAIFVADMPTEQRGFLSFPCEQASRLISPLKGLASLVES